MGCKGPMTFNNCSIVRYNEAVNWPIGVGRGCIGCSEKNFWDNGDFYNRLPSAGPSSIDMVGTAVGGAIIGAVGVHAAATLVHNRFGSHGKDESHDEGGKE